MNNAQLGKWTGFLFIVGALLVNVPYTLLILNFEYPGILREGAAEILTKFAAGGSGLIWQWFAFAWVGVPLLVAIILLDEILAGYNATLSRLAMIFGVLALVVQMIGLLRWTFVVPVLANVYTAPNASEATKEAARASFELIHQFGGVLLGEHLGQLFVIAWMVLVSVLLLRAKLFQPWLGWFGLGAALVYGLAQAELFATVMPNVPVLDIAGLAGSLLWLLWMVALGVFLVRAKNGMKIQPNNLTSNQN